MSKRNKRRRKFWNGWKKDTRLFCMIGIVIVLVCALYTVYNVITSKNQDYDETLYVDAVAVNVEKVYRNASQAQLNAEKEKGASDDELMYEWSIDYTYAIDDVTYNYHRTEKYDSDRRKPKVGDTYTLFVGIKDGEVTPNVETPKHAMFGGIITALIGGFIFFALAFFNENVNKKGKRKAK